MCYEQFHLPANLMVALLLCYLQYKYFQTVVNSFFFQKQFELIYKKLSESYAVVEVTDSHLCRWVAVTCITMLYVC